MTTGVIDARFRATGMVVIRSRLPAVSDVLLENPALLDGDRWRRCRPTSTCHPKDGQGGSHDQQPRAQTPATDGRTERAVTPTPT